MYNVNKSTDILGTEYLWRSLDTCVQNIFGDKYMAQLSQWLGFPDIFFAK